MLPRRWDLGIWTQTVFWEETNSTVKKDVWQDPNKETPTCVWTWKGEEFLHSYFMADSVSNMCCVLLASLVPWKMELGPGSPIMYVSGYLFTRKDSPWLESCMAPTSSLPRENAPHPSCCLQGTSCHRATMLLRSGWREGPRGSSQPCSRF